MIPLEKKWLILILLSTFVCLGLQSQDVENAAKYFNAAKYELAAEEFEAALPSIVEEYGKNDTSWYSKILYYTALSFELSQNNTIAEEYYLACNAVYENTKSTLSQYYSYSCNNLAGLYESKGNYKKAESLFLKAMQIIEKVLGKEHPEYANSCSNLAVLYESMGKYQKAEPLLLEALQTRKKVLGKEHPEYATSCNNLAGLYESMGNYQKAEPLLLEALQIIEKELGKKHPNYASSCNNLAVLYQSMGKYQKAEPLLLEAIQIREKVLGKEHPDYAISCNQLALLYKSMGNYQKAEQLFIESIAITNNNIDKNFAFLSEKEKGKYLETILFKYDIFNSFTLKRIIDNPQIYTLVFNNTLRQKGLLLKSSMSMRDAVLSSNDRQLKATLEEWIQTRSALANLYSLRISKRWGDPEKLEEKANTLEKILVRQSQEFSYFKKMQSTTWGDVKERLNPGEAIVEFIHFDYYDKSWTDSTIYCALVLKPDIKRPEMVPLFEEKQLSEILQKHASTNDAGVVANLYGTRGALQVSTDKKEYNTRLYQLIWQPLENLLQDCQKIYYSPTGLLHKISFAAIPYNEKHLLSDKYQLTYKASSASLVKDEEPFDIKSGNIAIYGGLNYNTDTTQMLSYANNYGNRDNFASRSISMNDSLRGGNWNYLKGTLKEAQSIQSLLQSKTTIDMYTGHLGLEESFKALTGKDSPAVIHIATHGFFFPAQNKKRPPQNQLVNDIPFSRADNPLMRSGLILSGGNQSWSGNKVPDNLEDGILTAYEASNMNLYNTELVVLSACETGLGDIKGSEGVYGLQRSFMIAGANNVMMSLWKVPDKETSEFMLHFYTNLANGQKVGDAFRKTQNLMKQKYDPYYWAAFVLME